MAFDSELDQIHRFILQGNGLKARSHLLSLIERKLPRSAWLRTASLLRRTGLYLEAVKLLVPLMRAMKDGGKVKATPAEQAEYALSLGTAGASVEALAILDGLDEKTHPQVMLYRSFLLANRWEYTETIPILTRFLSHPQVPAYERLTAKVNLAAALVFDRQHLIAGALLREILYETGLRGSSLLQGNALELASENFIAQREWHEAERALKKARELLCTSGRNYALIVRRWEIVMELLKSAGSPRARADLNALRKDLREAGHWEILRDCDRFEAIATQNRPLLQHLCFGTPFEAYRARVLTDYGAEVALPETYELRDARDSAAGPCLNLVTGQSSANELGLKLGTLTHRTAMALCGDFYRPFRVTTLFQALFPDERFNPISSPNRIHQAVKALREWFHRAQFPCDVAQEEGEYRLVFTGPGSIRIGRAPAAQGRSKHLLERMLVLWPERTFTAKEASEALGISGRTVLRLLGRAQTEGLVDREGKRAAARYRFRKSA